MATKEQYEYFKFKYQEEDERNALLTKRAEIYLSILSFVFTGLVFKMQDIKEYCQNSTLFVVLFLCFISTVVISVSFVLIALKVRDYTSDLNVEDYTAELGETVPRNEDFFDNRIVSFMYATPKNFEQNNIRANNLKFSGIFIFLSFVFISAFVILAVTYTPSNGDKKGPIQKVSPKDSSSTKI